MPELIWNERRLTNKETAGEKRMVNEWHLPELSIED
jgi:hypothetical protein